MIGDFLAPTVPTHPDHNTYYYEMCKWRTCFDGGEYFRDSYLKTLLTRETPDDFIVRKSITPIPGFASEGIVEIRDSIFQHFPQIRRLGGSKTFHRAINGLDNGVDLLGQSMNAFIGNEILIELLLMGKVGVFVDMPETKGPTLADNKGQRPYIYKYARENILNWCYDESEEPNEFQSLLLANKEYIYQQGTGFPIREDLCYRELTKTPDGVFEQRYNSAFKPTTEPKRLRIARIPFVLFEINDSLMRRVADHQIALMNLGSLDMNFFTKSNFPLYIEKKSNNDEHEQKTIVVGPSKGRAYSGDIPPDFISPSSDSITASIAKQEQLKAEIRDLLALGVAQARTVSGPTAKGNKASGKGLETGLSHIGLTLQQGEQQIASYWGEFENDEDVASIFYPTVYQSKSDSERIDEAMGLAKLIDKTPSTKYQKAVAKKLARSLLFGEVSSTEMDEIEREIDKAEIVQSDSETIDRDAKGGLVDPENASRARGYPKGSVEKAQKAQAERLAIIAIAQSKGAGAGAAAPVVGAARGVTDASPISTPTGQSQSQDEKVASKANVETATTAPNLRGADKSKRKGKQ